MAMSKLGVRNIDSYNARLIEARKKGEVLSKNIQVGFDPETGQPIFEDQEISLTPLPYIVVIIDEVAESTLEVSSEIKGGVILEISPNIVINTSNGALKIKRLRNTLNLKVGDILN